MAPLPAVCPRGCSPAPSSPSPPSQHGSSPAPHPPPVLPVAREPFSSCGPWCALSALPQGPGPSPLPSWRTRHHPSKPNLLHLLSQSCLRLRDEHVTLPVYTHSPEALRPLPGAARELLRRAGVRFSRLTQGGRRASDKEDRIKVLSRPWYQAAPRQARFRGCFQPPGQPVGGRDPCSRGARDEFRDTPPHTAPHPCTSQFLSWNPVPPRSHSPTPCAPGSHGGSPSVSFHICSPSEASTRQSVPVGVNGGNQHGLPRLVVRTRDTSPGKRGVPHGCCAPSVRQALAPSDPQRAPSLCREESGGAGRDSGTAGLGWSPPGAQVLVAPSLAVSHGTRWAVLGGWSCP